MKRSWLVIFLVIAILAVIKFVFFRSATPQQAGPAQGQPQAVPVTAVVVRPIRLDQTIYATGSVRANEDVDLHPEVSGKLVAIRFKEGSRVSKGDLLVKINDADLQAQLHKNSLDRKLAEESVQRNEKLVAVKGISQQEYEELQNAVAGLDAEKDVILAQIQKTEIHAPFDGVIGLKTVSEGSYVSPETRIASLQQIDPVKIDFSIPEKYAGLVKPGDEIMFTVGAGTTQYKGSIYAIEPKVDESTRTVQIRALCPNAKGDVLPGAFARITLVLKQLDNVLMVPTESIIPVLKGKQVFVSRNGKAQSIDIETGIRNDTAAQVLNGISPNDTVITSGLMQLKPGTAVKLTLKQ